MFFAFALQTERFCLCANQAKTSTWGVLDSNSPITPGSKIVANKQGVRLIHFFAHVSHATSRQPPWRCHVYACSAS